MRKNSAPKLTKPAQIYLPQYSNTICYKTHDIICTVIVAQGVLLQCDSCVLKELCVIENHAGKQLCQWQNGD